MGFSNVWKSSILEVLIIELTIELTIEGTTYVGDLKA